jgi:hypothetical protein
VSLARRALAAEAGVWLGLGRWLGRRWRPGSGTEATEHGYARLVTPMFWLFIAMSAVEVVVLHLLLPWATVQAVSAVVGIWGLLWMLGMLAALHAHPHVVSASGLRVRYGTAVDVTVPWATVTEVAARPGDHPGSRSIRLVESDRGTVLVLAVGSQTSVDVRLGEPVVVRLPAGPAEVVAVRLNADDPRRLVAATRASRTASGAV